MDKLTRRQIRYICFRTQTEEAGGAKVGKLEFASDVKKHMESQDEFDEWKNFAKTWDVGDKAPLVVVLRTSSIQTDWNKVLKEEAKELPKEKKFLTNKLSEKVQERKQAAEHLETKQETAEIKQVKNDLREEVQENRKQSKKTSFWDRLK